MTERGNIGEEEEATQRNIINIIDILIVTRVRSMTPQKRERDQDHPHLPQEAVVVRPFQ